MCSSYQPINHLFFQWYAIILFFVEACNVDTHRLLYVSVGHAGNKIDEVWQQISRRVVIRTGRNFAGNEWSS